jgi:stigma-specific protein Stig1
MDPTVFDALARASATAGSRRRLLALLAALPMGRALTALGAAAAAQKRHHHHHGGLGCSPCNPGETCCGARCVNLDRDPIHCGACGHQCANHKLCMNGICCSNHLGVVCSGREPCCLGIVCQNGRCCQGPGLQCSANADCCSKQCDANHVCLL